MADGLGEAFYGAEAWQAMNARLREQAEIEVKRHERLVEAATSRAESTARVMRAGAIVVEWMTALAILFSILGAADLAVVLWRAL